MVCKSLGVPFSGCVIFWNSGIRQDSDKTVGNYPRWTRKPKSDTSEYVSLADLKCFTRFGRIFCLLTAYFDESYNSDTFCVGGWLCSDAEWDKIERRWTQRIEYERHMSIKKKQKPISRFHASDCATRNGEYRGWSIDRQIRLMKKLTDIIGESTPVGFAVAAGLGDLVRAYPHKKKERWQGCYYYCMFGISD